ncbi:MAG: hypothetical protein DMG35_00845 [Acidobacteria bacterium]|nr:MAG: hypothetical protein AUH86_19595 [Acidobacteria bacterium 13_1_40CM_4_58_4]PYT64330.1 MAG: hypothetical protein DMG35_00845 [Acidobacteriota bacterium]
MKSADEQEIIAKLKKSKADLLSPSDLVATLHLTDGGNADYVERCYPGRIKYQKEGDIWYVADENCRWREDKVGEGLRLIELAMREKYETTARVVNPKDKERHRYALNSCNAVKIAHCAQVLRARKTVAVPPGAFDANPWLLGVENGILDLQGEKEKLVEGDLGLLVAKRAPVYYAPEVAGLRWDKYLERVQPDSEMRACLAQIFGACLTGIQIEKCFIFFLGEGGNGKSTFQRVMMEVLGDYAFKCKKALIFQPNRNAGEQAAGANDVADLAGMRLISAAEQVGKHWNLEFIKDYTGGEKQHARQLYQRRSNFKPTAKIVIPANEEPVMDEFNEAIRRRFALLRWDVTLTPGEKQPFEPYIEWLMEASSGILNFALAGLAALKKNGMRLALPASAEKSTQEYLDEQDQVSRFLEATYEDAKEEDLLVSEIYARYKTTWLEEDQYVMSKSKFTRRLKNHYGKKRVGRGAHNRMTVSEVQRTSGRGPLRARDPEDCESHSGRRARRMERVREVLDGGYPLKIVWTFSFETDAPVSTA